MTQRPEQKMPWVVVGPTGVYWLGHAHSEKGAWTDALGWPDDEEVAEHKRAGWYAAEATVSWKRPDGLATPRPVHPDPEGLAAEPSGEAESWRTPGMPGRDGGQQDAAGVNPSDQSQRTRRCGHPLGTTRWCPDCELQESRNGR